MNIAFESLNLLPAIDKRLIVLEKILSDSSDKRWLNTTEVSSYMGYSKENIYKMVQRNELILGVHYHKRCKKLLFDKNEVDNWVMGINTHPLMDMNQVVNSTIEEIISSIA